MLKKGLFSGVACVVILAMCFATPVRERLRDRLMLQKGYIGKVVAHRMDWDPKHESFHLTHSTTYVKDWSFGEQYEHTEILSRDHPVDVGPTTVDETHTLLKYEYGAYFSEKDGLHEGVSGSFYLANQCETLGTMVVMINLQTGQRF